MQAAVAASQEDLHAAMELGQAAEADRLPQLSLRTASIWTQSFNGTPRYVSANGAREIIGELAIAAPLYAPQLQALAKLAHDASALAQSQLQLTQLQVGTQIVDAWFQLALAQNQQALWQQSLARNHLLYSQVQQAFHAGATARLNLVQTRLLLTQAQNQYAQAQSAVRSARRALNLELALPPFRSHQDFSGYESPRQ